MNLGLVDWGVGGLSVYQRLISKKLNITYLSDSGAMPYGKMAKPQLIQRLQLVCDFFRTKNIQHIVIACNAASTVLNEVKRKNPDLVFYGMLDSGAELVRKSKVENSLIIGGKRTVLSKYFQTRFKNSRIKTQVKIAQPLSAFIEKGDMSSILFQRSLKKVFSNLKFKPDSVLLACTHYPAIEKQIKQLVPTAKILDPSTMIIKKISRKKEINFLKKTDQFYTTGLPSSMVKSAQKAFGLNIRKLTKISL
ncbi:MAG: aspartate/glutamate racemase family protein [Bdellovibrio sp.]|nr:aspartate/glutamate racemase family protein [Bdellovibrio sp.]